MTGVSLSELRQLGGWKSLHMVLRYSRHGVREYARPRPYPAGGGTTRQRRSNRSSYL